MFKVRIKAAKTALCDVLCIDLIPVGITYPKFSKKTLEQCVTAVQS